MLPEFSHLLCQVPDKPPQSVEDGRNIIDQKILQKLQKVCFPRAYYYPTPDLRIALRGTPSLDPHVSFQSDGSYRNSGDLEVRQFTGTCFLELTDR
jgi:hypothetical protein